MFFEFIIILIQSEGGVVMCENLIIKHCAPTLAGLKTGSLFNCSFNDFLHLQDQIVKWNGVLNPKGVQMNLLRHTEDKALIYVYRPKKLAHDIEHDEVKDFLLVNGYISCDAEYCVKQLSNRLSKSKKFPHEIGLFLGYPLQDVKEFIKNQGKYSKHVGYWKVYFNECEAVKTFEKFKKCTNTYCKLFAEGRPISRLTIAS